MSELHLGLDSQIQLHFTVDPKHFLVIPLVSPFFQIGCRIKLADGAFVMLMNELVIEPPYFSKQPEE